MEINKMKNKEKEWEKQFHTNVTFDDIVSKTDFFDVSIKKKKQKQVNYLKLSLSCVSVFLVVFVILFGVTYQKNVELKNKEPDTIYVDRIVHSLDPTTIIQKEELDKMCSMCDGFNNVPYYSIQVSTSLTLYIYRGLKLGDDNTIKTLYFYSMSGNDLEQNMVILQSGKEKITITSENRTGLLKEFASENETEEISFEIVYKNKVKKYNLNY